MDKNVFTIPSTIGPPNAKRAAESITVPHGQGVIIDMCARGYDGHPLPNPEDHDFYLAVSRSADGAPLEEWHIGDPQVSLIDPAMSKTRFRLRFADLAPYLQEGVSFRFDGWSQRIQPEMEDPVRHVQGTITLGPSILGQRQPFFDLTSVGFNDLLGPVSDNVYLVDLRTGFKGGQLPIAYTASAGGIVNDTLVLSREAVVSRTVTVTATDGRNDEAVADFQQITYAPLVFGTLADVTETQEANGTIDISLSVGFTGGDGNRVYEADRGTVNGSVLTLSLDQVFAGAVTVSATDEDENVATGSFQFTVQAAATAPAQMTAPAVTSDAPGVFTATFIAPDDGGSTITRFDIQWSTDGATWTGQSGVTSPVTITGLAGGDYFVQVRAANEIGTGAYSPSGEVTVTAPVAPYTPEPVNLDSAGVLSKTLPGYTPDRINIVGGFRVPEGGTTGNNACFECGPSGVPMSMKIDNNGFLYYKMEFRDAANAQQLIVQTTGQADGSQEIFVAGDVITFAANTRSGGQQLAYYSKNNGPWTQLCDPDPIPADWTIDVNRQWRLSRDVRAVDIGGFGLYFPTATPDIITSKAQYVHSSGWPADPAITRAHVGVDPVLEQYGDAAAYVALTNTGTGGAWDSLSGTVTDLAPPEAPAGDGEVVHTSAQLVDGSYFEMPNLASPYFSDGTDDLTARLSIKKSRTSSIVPGEVVYFEVEGLTQEEWITWGFIWEFQTTGLFRHTGGLPPMFRQKNFGVGPNNMCAWDADGTYTVTLRVIPPAYTGKEGCVLTTTVQVDPLSSLITAANTYVVAHPDGTSQNAPEGTVYPDFIAAVRAVKAADDFGRIRVPAGFNTLLEATGLNVDRHFNGVAEFLMIDSWGDTSGGQGVLQATESWLEFKSLTGPKRVLIKDVDFEANYDVTTGNGARLSAIQADQIAHFSMNRVNARGLQMLFEGISTGNDIRVGQNSTMFWDCDITRWENYGAGIIKQMDNIGMKGSAALQDVDAVNGTEQKTLGQSGNYPDHASLRIGFTTDSGICFTQNDCFSNNGWSPATPAENGDARTAHQGVRPGGNEAAGMRANTTCNLIEGGGFGLDGGGNERTYAATDTNLAHNVIMMTTNSTPAATFGHSGMGLHDNIIIMPAAPTESKKTPRIFDANRAGAGTVVGWENSSFDNFSNTMYVRTRQSDVHVDRMPTYADLMTVGFTSWDLSRSVEHTTEFPTEREFNNVLHAPALTLSGEGAPRAIPWLTDAGQFVRDALYKGLRIALTPGVITTDPATASPAGTGALLMPDASAEAAEVAPFDSALDFFCRVKTATPNKGAVQHKVKVL